jgi:sarcosine oxidase, subunit gamma
VIAEAVRRSPLADYRQRFLALSTESRGELILRELPFLTQVNFRTDAKDTGTLQRITSTLEFALPMVPNTVTSRGDRRALWLGPDEWLIVGRENEERAVAEALRDALGGAFGSIADVSANRTILEISGPRARDLLAHGVPIDLDMRAFGQGHCAQTLLAKTQVIIERRDQSAFHLYARNSFACYVGEWLLDSHRLEAE